MTVTIQWMERWFDTFNAEYFDARLPRPAFALSRARTRLGQMACKQGRVGRGVKRYDFRISITTYYDMTERQAQCVLLHEMIHYVIAYTGLRDSAPHGVVFRGMADALNRRYGWDIRVTTSARDWRLSPPSVQREQARSPRRRLVLALSMTDGKYFLSCVNPRYAHALSVRLRGLEEVRSQRWYTTTESYFDSFPDVRSLRGRRISHADFDRLCHVLTPVDKV